MTDMTENRKTERRQKIASAKNQIKQRVAARKGHGSGNPVTPNKLKLLFTVVGRRKAEYYTDLLQSFDVNMQMVMLAQGTANEKMMNYLGLTDTNKVVILSVIQENKIPDALRVLEEKFNTIKDGKGVACTVPLSSVIGTLIYGFLSNNKMVVKES